MLVAPLANSSETEFTPGANPWRSEACVVQPDGRLSSSSANTMFVARMPPKFAIAPMPGSAPPTFCWIRRSARPMLAPAGRCGSGPRQPKPAFRRICFEIGPLTITTGNALPEAACNCSALVCGSRKASTAAISTGRYSGRPPAIASAIAQVSTVARPPRGGNLPSRCSRGSALPARIRSTRSRVAGHNGRPSPCRLVISKWLARSSASS